MTSEHLQFRSEILSRSNMAREELWPGHRFRVCVHCDLDLVDITFGPGHDTPLSHEKQWSETLSRSNMAVRSYGPDTDFWYVCNVTLPLGV